MTQFSNAKIYHDGNREWLTISQNISFEKIENQNQKGKLFSKEFKNKEMVTNHKMNLTELI